MNDQPIDPTEEETVAAPSIDQSRSKLAAAIPPWMRAGIVMAVIVPFVRILLEPDDCTYALGGLLLCPDGISRVTLTTLYTGIGWVVGCLLWATMPPVRKVVSAIKPYRLSTGVGVFLTGLVVSSAILITGNMIADTLDSVCPSYDDEYIIASKKFLKNSADMYAPHLQSY